MKGLVEKSMEYSYIHSARMGNLEFAAKGFRGHGIHHLISATDQKEHGHAQMGNHAAQGADGFIHGQKRCGSDPGMHQRILLVGRHHFRIMGEMLRRNPRGNLQILEGQGNLFGQLVLQHPQGSEAQGRAREA